MNYIDRLNIYCRRSLDNIWSKPSWYFRGNSAYWRTTGSNIEPIELARVLKSLTRVVGHIGMNVGRVIWTGLLIPGVDIDRASLVFPPEFVMGDYPVPPGKMDVLVGVAAHEALRQTEWSDVVWKEMIKKRPELNESLNFRRKDTLWKLFSAGENIYLDKKLTGHILAEYTGKARKALIGGSLGRDPMRAPTPGSLFDLWEEVILGNIKSPEVNPLYIDPLNKLRERTIDLCSTPDDGQRRSIIEQCRRRADVYLKMWEDLEPLLQGWELDPITYFDKDAVTLIKKEKKRRKKDQAKERQSISEETWGEINRELAIGSSDLTPAIMKICDNDEKVLRTTLCDFTAPAKIDTDRHLVQRLKNIFQHYAERQKKINRGLESGKVDRRRLYRAPIDGRCFKIEQMLSEIAWNFTVVIDASISMAGAKWLVVENTMNALYRALQGYKNELRIFGYFEYSGVCIISELFRKNQLYSIAPTGRTPSGQAILAAALLMPREKKGRKFLLHITDGESNAGVDVRYGIDYCEKEDINLVTLGVAYKDKDILIEQYGKKLQFLNTIDELPKAVERLFQRILRF
jgi:hypothetical protein